MFEISTLPFVMMSYNRFCNNDCFNWFFLICRFNYRGLIGSSATKDHDYAHQDCNNNNSNDEPQYNHSDAITLMNDNWSALIVPVAVVLVAAANWNYDNRSHIA